MIEPKSFKEYLSLSLDEKVKLYKNGDDKIQQLEKENAAQAKTIEEQHQLLSDKFGVGLTVERYKEMAKGYAKVGSLKIENKRLKADVAELKSKAEHYEKVAQIAVDKLANQKYLDRQEVEKILTNMDLDRFSNNCACWRGEMNIAITAICNLALIDK